MRGWRMGWVTGLAALGLLVAPGALSAQSAGDEAASAKLVADWGVDYMHLAKENGRWMIKNILWQSPPQG